MVTPNKLYPEIYRHCANFIALYITLLATFLIKLIQDVLKKIIRLTSVVSSGSNRSPFSVRPVVKREQNEPHHDKTVFRMCKNKGVDQLRGDCTADQCLCFRYIKTTTPILSKSKISSL